MKGSASVILLTIFLFSISFCTLKAQYTNEEEYQMKQYFMVFLLFCFFCIKNQKMRHKSHKSIFT